jgi:hypothetical protein
MTQKANRKRRTREHIIADLSVNHVERFILQCGWTAQRISPDYGIDLIMETFDTRGRIENGAVKFQLKATDSLQVAWWLYLQESLRHEARGMRVRLSTRLTLHVPLSNVLDTEAIRHFARLLVSRLRAIP